MSFIFTMKSAHRRDPSNLSASLPAISEDGTDYSFPRPPPGNQTYVPTTTPLRASPESWDGVPGSAFSDTSSVAGVKAEEEKAFGLRNKKAIAKRGGWKRLALVALIVALCIVGLVVGLVVGLRNRDNLNNSSEPWSQTTNSILNTTFPAGSYSISTVLSQIDRNCTSNPSTWRCYPDVTYPESQSQSSARFDWIIRAYTSTSTVTPTYTVSSTQNPFSLLITNQTLTLQDRNLSTEHYSFSFAMVKPVIPGAALTSDNLAATCYFNQTVFEASLFTRMNPTIGNVTALPFQPWPYAVSMEQTADSGTNVPQCYGAGGNLVGDFSVSGGAQCSCSYMNYGI